MASASTARSRRTLITASPKQYYTTYPWRVGMNTDRYWERLEKKIDKFMMNDFRHMAEDVASLKTAMKWVYSLLFLLLAAAVGLLGREIFL